MRLKNIPVFLALFLLFVVALQWLWEPGEESSVAESTQAEPSRQAPALPDGGEVEPAPDAATPVMASPPAWSPPAVFGQAGTPSPKIPYPRGEHASRRYHDAVSREIDPQLLLQRPAVLAKSPRDGRLELSPEEMDAHTKAAVRLVFDPAALDQVVQGQTARVLVPTPGEEVLTLEFEKIRTRSANTHTLQGHLVGEAETSMAQIVYHDGILRGSVMRYDTGQEIEYRIMEDGLMMVRELDQESLAGAECGSCASGKEGVPHAHAGADSDIQADIENQIHADLATEPTKQSGEEQEPVSRDTSGWRTIDVAVGYSAQARSSEGGASQIEATIIASVDRMTLALANSGITDTEIVLVGTIEDPNYAEPGTGSDLGDELIDLRNDDGNNPALNAVTDYATQLGADLISFLTVTSQGGQSGVANSGNRYTINSLASMTAGQMVFAHELGHNLGCAHAWNDSSPNNTGANMGWRFQGTSGTKYTTIMAYGAGWNNSRIPYYSNPNVLHPDGDIPTGCVPGYDATNDSTVDSQLKPGYDGSVATRGANNANTIDTGEGHANYGATVAAAWDTRTAFSVLSPSGGDQIEPGYTYTIFFGGSDMHDLADILLYKGGVLHTTLASGVNAATHASFSWSLPFDFEEGTDYMIRVELNRNGSTLTAESGIFSILNNLPNVVAQDPTDAIAPRSQLSVTFNLPMDTATFSTGPDIASFTDPDGTDITGAISGASWSAQDTVLTIDFAAQSKAGTYQLVLGPDIRDTFDNPMDQDGDGTAGESIEDRYTMNFTLAQVPAYYANMDTDPGWTFDHQSWGYGQPTGGNQDGKAAPDPSAGVNGPNIIGYRLDGDFEANIPETRWATTPAIDCSNYTNVTLSFQRWLGVDKSFDRAYIQASTNGVTWTPVWENDTTVYLNESTWGLVEYDISAIADGQATVYIRWGMGKTDDTWHMCGWNIDEVLVDGDLIDGVVLLTATGGESYFADTAVSLSWGSSLAGDVQIELLKNGSVDSTITSTTANDGAYTWQVPAGQVSGSDYRIRITSLDDPSKAAESAADFTIISIRVTSPNGGESYYAGSTADLSWDSSIGGDVKIELLKGGSVDSTITSSTANDGSYAWQVPFGQAAGSDYRIRITSLVDPTKTAESDLDFTINALPSVPYSESFASGFGAWAQESTDDIDWTRNTGTTVSIDTGPNDGQEGTGDYYLYTEATGNSNKLAQIFGWFDLTTAAQPEFSFYYHMLGDSMGTLTVEASTDDVVWDELFLKSGDQGSSWVQATVSLSDYAGQLVKLRISGTTGSSYTSDIAVDSFTLTETDTGGDFAGWISGYDVGGLTAPGDDFDKDGIPNAVENYFGTNPGVHNAGLAMTQVADGGAGGTTFAFTHPISDNPATDLTAIYRWSKDLSSFHSNGVTDPEGTRVDFSVGTPTNGEVTVTATVSGTETDSVFVTVDVIQESF